jgi:hypothetical protein
MIDDHGIPPLGHMRECSGFTQIEPVDLATECEETDDQYIKPETVTMMERARNRNGPLVMASWQRSRINMSIVSKISDKFDKDHVRSVVFNSRLSCENLTIYITKIVP